MRQMTEQSAGMTGSRWKRILLVFFAVFFLVVSTYIVGRVRSLEKAVSVQTLSEPGPAEYDGNLRIGAYNIAHGRGPVFGASNWDGTLAEKKKRMEEIGVLLQQLRLDVVVLNEADFSSLWSGHVDQAQAIAESAGFPYMVRQRNIDVAVPLARLRFGNAVLSRYPIVDATLHRFPDLSPRERWLVGGHDSVIVRIALPHGNTVAVWAVHLEVRSEAVRAQAAGEIVAYARASHEPLIVAGDFNSAPRGFPHHHKTARGGGSALDVLLDSGLFGVFPPAVEPGSHFTFPSQQPARTIDWILTSNMWETSGGTVVDADFSDHLPLVVTARLRSLDEYSQ